ncbi:MAG: hypothetical protein OEM60_06895, partial [Gammaproteobacteria bacterium]|nr:hypothetical protein [Gammaproteobacteria bacterium]
MNSKLTEKEQSIQEDFAKSEHELDGLKGDLQAIDTELGELAQRNHQYELLSTVCRSLDELENLGASRLFWGDHSGSEHSAEHIQNARRMLAEFNA